MDGFFLLVGILVFLGILGASGFLIFCGLSPLPAWIDLRRRREPLPLWCRVWGWGWLALAQAAVVAVASNYLPAYQTADAATFTFLCGAAAFLCWGLSFFLRRHPLGART